MATKAKTVYFNFTPASPAASKINAEYDKGTAAANKARDEMTDYIIDAKGLKGDEAKRVRAGKKWGQWSYWFADEASETKAKGETL